MAEAKRPSKKKTTKKKQTKRTKSSTKRPRRKKSAPPADAPVEQPTAAAPVVDELEPEIADAPQLTLAEEALADAITDAEVPGFDELGLSKPILAALKNVKFEKPSAIQAALIPVALSGKDCLGQARTGTGKTAAFALPILQMIKPGQPLQALVLVPTRELAAQVDDAVRKFTYGQKLRTVLIYGGQRMKRQTDQLAKGPEFVVGTPGRILDLMRRNLLDVSKMRFAVLDEVDRMLDIGFRDDIRRILRKIESAHQTIFVSATIDDEIRKLAKAFMKDPVEVNVSGDALTVENIEHGFVPVVREDKFQTLLGFLKHEVPALAIVFTNTKHNARRIAEKLKKENISCQEIHGDLHQSKREKVMAKFRKSAIQVLVATDLASRGLDVMEVSHIVNYDVPEDSAAYVHRIGRTARMGQRGYAVTFVTPNDGDFLTNIEKLLNQELPQFDTPWTVKREAPKPEPEAEAAAPPPSERLTEAWQRDSKLEQIGLRPVRRTLGSRFRTTRKFKR